ncbi:MAG TPA: hypothetical protein VGH92_05480 [Gaiellaceae bacterium]
MIAAVRLLLLALIAAVSPGQIVAKLNAQRVANGIPGGITLNAAGTLGCEHHVRYEERNGITWTHQETPGKPGYTKDGMLAGIGGDQSYTSGWEFGNPFENLPLHMATLMSPALMQIGTYESGRRVCMDISVGGGRQFATDELFTYPGNGRANVPTSQMVHGEWPASPGDVVGLPQGRTTGPTIYVFSVGPWQYQGPFHLSAAKVVGPGGPVAIRVVDPRQHPKINPYVAAGAFFLIPVSPLRSHAHYTATVTVAGPSDTISKTIHFTTS